jgi:hypothetical protein
MELGLNGQYAKVPLIPETLTLPRLVGVPLLPERPGKAVLEGHLEQVQVEEPVPEIPGIRDILFTKSETPQCLNVLGRPDCQIKPITSIDADRDEKSGPGGGTPCNTA